MSTRKLKPIAEALSQSQRFLLEWLSREDWSQKGECKGADLDALYGHDLIKEGPQNPRGDDYRLVGLNPEGFVVLHYIRREVA